MRTFEELRKKDAASLPMYLMAGELFADEGHGETAREWLEAGLALATKAGNTKAQSELEAALQNC